MPPDSIDTSQEQTRLSNKIESLTSLERKNDLELPSFAPFIEYKRYDDASGVDSTGNKIALHKCILAAKTNFFDLDNNDILDLKDSDLALIRAVYDGHCESGVTVQRLYSTLESRFARLNLFATGQYSDLILVADDGEIAAHRILLASGSELMRAMLIGSWRESSSPTIRLTELTRDQLAGCCRWIYARVMPDWSTPTKKLIQLIPAASRLCLSCFLRQLEFQIIERLKTSPLHIGLRFGILALEIAEQHNAKRLTAWITRHLSVHFNEINSIHKAQFLELTEAKREIIEKERWPPSWYIRERDLYERTIKQLKDVKRS